MALIRTDDEASGGDLILFQGPINTSDQIDLAPEPVRPILKRSTQILEIPDPADSEAGESRIRILPPNTEPGDRYIHLPRVPKGEPETQT